MFHFPIGYLLVVENTKKPLELHNIPEVLYNTVNNDLFKFVSPNNNNKKINPI